MKIVWPIIAILLLLIFVWVHGNQSSEHERSSHVDHIQPAPELMVDDSIQRLHSLVGGMLVAMKDPYRPPLGDNLDIARALVGQNRYGYIWLNTNDPLLNERGQLVDPWGSPYHFHPRSSDAIDIRSAGPDRILFTSDDIESQHGRPVINHE